MMVALPQYTRLQDSSHTNWRSSAASEASLVKHLVGRAFSTMLLVPGQ